MKLGLNVGSGQRPFISTEEVRWVNIDCVAHEGMPAPDIITSGNDLPYIDGTIDYVVLHQVLEHSGLGEADSMVREIYRVLKPSGSLLVFVPDLRELAIAWLTEKLDTITYAIALYGAYMGHDADRHRFGYDRELLTGCLSRCCEWKEVKPFDWRSISGADCARDYWVLAVECVK